MRFDVFDETQAVLPVARGRLYRGIKTEEIIIDVLDEDLAQVFARQSTQAIRAGICCRLRRRNARVIFRFVSVFIS